MRSQAISYNDSAPTITEDSDQISFGDHALIKITSFDQLGRVRETQDWAQNKVQTRYLTPQSGAGLGYSYELVSNPYVTQSEPSMGWTLTTRDQLGRVTAVSNFSGSTLPSPWAGNGSLTGVAATTYTDNCTTSADEASVSRTSCVDGLGRIKQVTENGSGAIWSYAYDVLDKPGVGDAACRRSPQFHIHLAKTVEHGDEPRKRNRSLHL